MGREKQKGPQTKEAERMGTSEQGRYKKWFSGRGGGVI